MWRKLYKFVTSQNSKFWNVILNKLLWLLFYCCVIDCVKVIRNWKLFESWMRGNKRISQNFASCILIFLNSNSLDHKTLEWRWYDFFHLKKWKGVWKWFEFHLKYFKLRNFKQLTEFMREDKMTSSYLWKESWKFQRNKLEVTLKLFETHFPFEVVWNSKFKSNWELFEFLFKIFSPKNK